MGNRLPPESVDGIVRVADLDLEPRNPMIDEVFPLARRPAGSGSVGLAVNFASVEGVDEFYARATDAGAHAVKPPAKAFWGGYSGNFRDLDGHLWEVAYNP